MKRIHYEVPSVKCYSHHAFPLGIILSNKNAEGWFYCNYDMLYFGGALNKYNFLVQYSNNPFLYLQDINKKDLAGKELMEDCQSWIKTKLDYGYAVLLFVDQYYLPDSKCFRRKHYPHEILITGYDRDRFIYWDYKGSILKELECDVHQIVITSDEYFGGKGVVAKIYSSKDGEFEYEEKFIWKQIKDYYNSENPYDYLAIWGDYHAYKNFVYGRSANMAFINDCKKCGYIDMRYADVFYEHKKCMRMRMEYMIKKGSKFLSENDLKFWEKIEKEAEKTLYLVVKQMIKDTKKIEGTSTIFKILDKYQEICDWESEWIKNKLERLEL